MWWMRAMASVDSIVLEGRERGGEGGAREEERAREEDPLGGGAQRLAGERRRERMAIGDGLRVGR